MALGLYLHVPFCARSCDFCHFYQEVPQRGEIERYLAGMEASLQARALPEPLSTVFWGGGTPGLLPARDLERLCRAVLAANGNQSPAEWSVEMAPATVKADKIRLLLDHGVNRISVGVQSFREAQLAELGRIHSASQVWRALEVLHAENVPSINIDLIFAIPGQTLDDWRCELETAIGAGTHHLSTYCLTFEEDTALWLRLQRGKVSKLSADDEAGYFQLAWEVLATAGWEQYEVSNYALPGHACEHNLNTWRMEEWIGHGPSASSQFQGRRWTEPHSLDQWLEGLESGSPRYADEVELTPAMLAQDALIFGLRMNAGLDLPRLNRRFGDHLPHEWPQFMSLLQEAGYAGHCGNCFRLTPTGRLLADRIGHEILMLD